MDGCMKLNYMFFRVHGVVVQLEVISSMTDGKARNFWFDEASSQSCAFCTASPVHFNEAFDWATVSADAFDMGISLLHILIKAMEAMVRLGTKLNLPNEYRVYNHPNDGVEGKMWQRIKDRLKEISHLIVIDRLQHNNIGNNGNVARVFFNSKWNADVANVLNVSPGYLHKVGLLVRAMKCGYRVNTVAYREVARKVPRTLR